MAFTELTDASVRTMKPKEAIYRVGDSNLKGLGVVVYPTGKKTFNWKGRVNGAVKTYTLGNHPAHSVEDVRQLAQSILLGKLRGIDAALHDHTLPISPMIHETRTCDWAFAKYMEQEGGLRKSAAEKWRIYRKEVQPAIGHKSIYHIRYDDIAEIVQKKFTTAPIMSNNMVSLMKRYFRWCVTKGRHVTKLEVNPISDVMKLASPSERERYLDDYELSILLSLSLANQLEISRSQATRLLRDVPMFVAVVVNAHEPSWKDGLVTHGIQYMVARSFRSPAGDVAVELDGELYATRENLGFGTFSATDSAIRLPLTCLLADGTLQVESPGGALADWRVQRDGVHTWIVKVHGRSDIPDQSRVQIIRSNGQRVSMRVTN
ncbi:Arm DNA-binding domain-containing protein [Sphingomonas sp. LHG3406-1]|uniref:Arm DNA-binding domain-containing protein n=1 Tax=Sphingomonas sp. LHG3406-1 TaxID=2804617 RepID=UPI002639F07B|nr:Arm DNA-binding domain-containing protein [Sphingomonas sp. LHG3406-1]